jgi:hypothetical protein
MRNRLRWFRRELIQSEPQRTSAMEHHSTGPGVREEGRSPLRDYTKWIGVAAFGVLLCSIPWVYSRLDGLYHEEMGLGCSVIQLDIRCMNDALGRTSHSYINSSCSFIMIDFAISPHVTKGNFMLSPLFADRAIHQRHPSNPSTPI